MCSNADGFSITWSFFGASYPYAILIGVSQILCSILILFPRTRLPGALILLPIAGNIVFVNYAYNIPVLLNSSVFLIMTAYLVLCEFDRLKAFFGDRGALPAVIPLEEKAITIGEMPVALTDLTKTLDKMADGNDTLVHVSIWSPADAGEDFLKFVRSVQDGVRQMKHQIGVHYKSLKAEA